MILVWGFKAISKTLSEGVFHCPREGGDRQYRHRSARKWFTFFWIPIIPLKELGDFVECSSCNSTFYPSVLTAPTTAKIADVLTIAVRHLAVAMAVADGVVDEAEKRVAVDIVGRFASVPYALENFEIDLLELAGADLTDQLEELGGILSEQGREQVLTAAVQLAAADGSIDASEMALAEQIGSALSMSNAHVRGVIAVATEHLITE